MQISNTKDIKRHLKLAFERADKWLCRFRRETLYRKTARSIKGEDIPIQRILTGHLQPKTFC